MQVTVVINWNAPSLEAAANALKWLAPDATPMIVDPKED